MPTKVCTRCERDLPAEKFKRNPKMRSGLDSWCLECHRQAMRDWHAKHDEEYNRQRRKHLPNVDCKGCGQSFKPSRYDQLYCSRPCSKRCEKRRARQRQVTRKRNGWTDSFDLFDPTIYEGINGFASAQYRRAMRHDPCAYCGAPCEQLDHIEPKSEGGPNEWKNYTASCQACNSAKRARPLLLFLLRQLVVKEMAPLTAELDLIG